MQRDARSWSLSVALALSVLLVAQPVFAQARSPVLNYLQTVIKPLLDATAQAIDPVRVGLSSILTAVDDLTLETDAAKATLEGQPTLHIVERTFTTFEDSTTKVNLDVESIPPVSFFDVKRYHVLAQGPASVSPGLAKYRLVVGLFDGSGTAFQATVTSVDFFTTGGVLTVDPYAGTNSFLEVTRGSDGRGPFNVRLNAYIESEH